ncbi:MAG TPA: rod-binding protein [Clostridia bacterium]|nr:rod-binding protein [Clostridia bacterium]
MDAGIGGITGSITQNITGNAVQSAAQSSDDTFARKLEEAAGKNDDKALKEACREFEAIMLSMMYKQMKATVIKSNLMEEDPGMEIFQSMQDDELMKQASKTGSFGLAESLYKQLSKEYGKTARAVTQSPSDTTGAVQSGAASLTSGRSGASAADAAGDDGENSLKAGKTMQESDVREDNGK